MFLITPVANAVGDLFVLIWDIALTFINLIVPNRKVGRVTPAGHPGVGGKWPEYVPPKEGDSRCSCPALNAMANHGILPHDGKNITFKQLNSTIRATYNFAPSFCYFVPNFAAKMLKRKYSNGTFDLKDLDLHNGIEHDASLLREDIYFVPDQGKPHVPYVKELLSMASGKDKDGNDLLTIKDLSEFSAKRRADSRARNPEFTLDTFHKMFGSSNSSTLLTIFGGRVNDLETFLIEEKLPENWESRILRPMGLTMATFNATVLKVERGIDESKYKVKDTTTSAEAPATATSEPTVTVVPKDQV